MRPAVAVYSAGAHNSYGHPHAATIRNLERVGAAIYGTDKDGTIVVSTDGTIYTVATARTTTSRHPLRSRPRSVTKSTAVSADASPAGCTHPTTACASYAARRQPCKQRVDAATAPNTPIVIVSVDKLAEIVTIRNDGAASVDLAGWTICSLLGSQLHAQLEGVLGRVRPELFRSQAGALHLEQPLQGACGGVQWRGQLISYWSEEAH